MERRAFLRRTGAAGAAAFGFSAPVRAQSGTSFADLFGISIAEFFDSDWSEQELVEELSDAVNFVCEVYGELDEGEEDDADDDEGLSRFGAYDLDSLIESEEFLRWFQENFDDVVDFVDGFGVISDSAVEVFERVSDRVSDYRKFVPLVASLKGLLESGCSLHSELDKDGAASTATYIHFFKNAALVVVEAALLLLSGGTSVSYQVAYRGTGWVNLRLINAVGGQIGWRAYSWVLSQIYWGIRVVMTEASGLAIDETVEKVVTLLIRDAAGQDTQLSETEVEQWVREDVKEIALEVGDLPDTLDWRLSQWLEGLDETIPDFAD